MGDQNRACDDVAPTYLVFLSYRSTDRSLAEWLHKKLESYRVPRALVGTQGRHGPIPARVRPVFRDRDDARPASDLKTVLADALAQSKHLVVLCTPAAADPASWVGREIEIFQERRPGGLVYPIIGRGQPPACFPKQLLSYGTDGRLGMPLAADLRPTSEGGDGRARAVVKLVAAITGASPDALWNRHRRRVVTRLCSVGALALVVLVAVAVLTVRAQQSARRERTQVLVQRAAARVAQDPLTAALILREIDGEYEPAGGAEVAIQAARVPLRPPTAPLLATPFGVSTLALSADGTKVVAAIQEGGAMIASLDRSHDNVHLDGPEAQTYYAAISPDGKQVVTASFDHAARVWSADGRQLTVLRGHTDIVNMASFSPDGKRILTTSSDATARLWDAGGKRAPVVFKGHKATVTSASFSSDGRHIVTASEDNTSRIWRVERPQDPIVLAGHSDSVVTAVFNSDGTRVLTASADGTARLWKATGEPTGIVLRAAYGEILSAAFDPTGKRVVTAGADRTARIWDSENGKQLHALRGHSDYISSASFSPDGRLIVTSSHDATSRLWDSQSGELVAVIRGHTDVVWGAAFTPDGVSVLTYSSDGRVMIWPASRKAHSKQAEPVVLYGHGDDVTHLSFSADGKHVLSASKDRSARVWKLDGEVIQLLVDWNVAQGRDIKSAVVSSDGRRFLVAADKSATAWSLNDLDRAVIYDHGRLIQCATFSPDGRYVATGGWDDTVRIWRSDDSGKQVEIPGITDGVKDIVFSLDGNKVLAVSSQYNIHVWRSDGSRELAVLRGHESNINTAAFNRDGSLIITASDDKTARVWPSDGSGKAVVLQHDDYVRSAQFSPDETRVVTASAERARIWRVDGTGEVLRLEGHKQPVTTAIFSPDGTRIATASWDKTVRIWNADHLGDAVVLQGHQGFVTRLAFAPDGKRIASGSDDNTVRIWRLDWRQLLTYLRESRQECLLPSQRVAFLGESSTTAQRLFDRCQAAELDKH